jgi:hypothetical protein
MIVIKNRKNWGMSVHGNDLFDVAQCALQKLNAVSAQSVRESSTSLNFGANQVAIARAETFQESLLIALRARFAEIKSVSK